MMPKPSTPETAISLFVLAPAVLIAACVLSACSHVPAPPSPVRLPVDIKDDTTVGSARLNWHDAPETTRAGSFTPGLEIEYDRGIGRTNQHLGTNEFIQIDNKTLSGPQEVRHHGEVRYGHLAFNGIWRFPGRAFKARAGVGGRPRTSATGSALREPHLGSGAARREVLAGRGGARRRAALELHRHARLRGPLPGCCILA